MEEIGRVFSAHTPNTVIGVGAVDNVATLARGLNAMKAFIVTAPGQPGDGCCVY